MNILESGGKVDSNVGEKEKIVESEVIVGITKLGEIELDVSLHSGEEFPDEMVNVKTLWFAIIKILKILYQRP